MFKPEIVWNVEKGLGLTGQEIMNAMVTRSEIYQRANEFFSTYDLVLTPATVVPPYPVEQRFVERVGDHKFSNFREPRARRLLPTKLRVLIEISVIL